MVPPEAGHNCPKILKRLLFPQPLGPEIIRCIPGLMEKFMFVIRQSPFGE